MSATEDDTELRDLLIQNLENSGVLNKLKAEMRAAVFLAMEEQDKLENKSPLINDNLKKCLNTKDGRLVASLMLDFLQVFHLDFTLAVFQPEINSLNGLDGRDVVCRELSLCQTELNKNSPLLLELVRRGRHKRGEEDRCGHVPVSKEPSQKQIEAARKVFDSYDKDGSSSVTKGDLKRVFTDLFPSLNQNMLDTFISEELRAADKQTFSRNVDFQLFVRLYKRLFADCRSVVLQDMDARLCPAAACKDLDGGPALEKRDLQQQLSRHSEVSDNKASTLKKQHLNLDLEDEPDDGDSFFDDPLPKPQKTYGCLSVRAADSEDERDDRLSEHSQTSEFRKVEVFQAREGAAGSLSETQRPGGAAAGGGGGRSSMSEQSYSRNGGSDSRERGCRDPKASNDKSGSLHLDDDTEYDDDFNSHRSDLSKSELSIGEEIEEVSIEGPDNSDKVDETTQDLSISQLSQSHGADYIEDVA